MKTFFVCLFLISGSSPAFAYIDPGSGSAIVSAIIGFFVASWLIIKTYWYKIKSFFFKSNDSDENNTADEDSDITR